MLGGSVTAADGREGTLNSPDAVEAAGDLNSDPRGGAEAALCLVCVSLYNKTINTKVKSASETETNAKQYHIIIATYIIVFI